MHVFFCVEHGICRRIWDKIEDQRGLMTQSPQFRIQQSGYCGREEQSSRKILKVEDNTLSCVVQE